MLDLKKPLSIITNKKNNIIWTGSAGVEITKYINSVGSVAFYIDNDQLKQYQTFFTIIYLSSRKVTL